MELIARIIPEPSAEERQFALHQAAKYALSKGVTTVGDMGRLERMSSVWDDFEKVRIS